MSRRMHNLFSRKTSTPLINVLIEVSLLVIVYAKASYADAGGRLISLLDWPLFLATG